MNDPPTDHTSLVDIAEGLVTIAETTDPAKLAELYERDLEAIFRADERLRGVVHIGEVCQSLVDVAFEVLKVAKTCIFIWDEKHEFLVSDANHGFAPTTLRDVRFQLGIGLLGMAAASRQPVIVQDAAGNQSVNRSITHVEGIRSFIHVPMIVQDEVFGVFTVSHTETHAITPNIQRILFALVRRGELAIENAQLYRQARLTASTEERQRLARDLHDSVTQTLFSASVIASVLPRLWDRDPTDARRRSEELRDLTRGALAEMRTLLLELRPSALTEVSFTTLLRQLADAAIGRTRLPVSLSTVEEDRLPADVQIALFRIAQEALNNVVKHSEATRIDILARSTETTAELRVTDNGRGFDLSSVAAGHLGVGGMQERAATISAHLSIESKQDRGTIVHVVWSRPAK